MKKQSWCDPISIPGWRYAALAAMIPVAVTAFRFARVVFRTVSISEAHIGGLVSKVLKAHGVKYIFVLPGGHVSPVVVECEASGIRVIDVRHEADAVFAADATSRLSGNIGVAVVTAGPGVTNTITAMKNAQMAQSPVLLIGGAAATITKGRGALQDIEQVGLFSSITKFAVSVSRIEDVVPTLRRAICIAQSGVPGPVFVEIPIDLMYPVLELQSQLGLASRKTKKDLAAEEASRVIVPVEHSGKTAVEYVKALGPMDPVFLPPRRALHPIVSFVLGYHLKRIFGNAWEDSPVDPLPVKFPTASISQISRALTILQASKHPVMIVGSQITLNPKIEKKSLSDALRAYGVPCFLSGMARGMMGFNHPCLLRHNRRQALRDADVVLLIGVPVDFRLDYGRVFNRTSKIIVVNRSREELKRNTDSFWKPFLSIEADPSDFIMRLKSMGKMDQLLALPNVDSKWVAELKRAEDDKDEKIARDGNAVARGHGEHDTDPLVNPLKLFTEIANVLRDRDDIIMIGDGGDFVGTAAYVVRPNGPCSWLDPGPYGTLGVGGGFAIASKLAHPQKHVLLFWGDGSAGYSLAEFDAFARHKCPIIAIVGNDACWNQIVRDQRTILRSEAGCNLAYCQYDAVARGYGSDGGGSKKRTAVVGETITAIADVAPSLRRALENSASGVSTLLNVLIGRSDFREGSSSV